ncbi:MAG: SpoIIE family protein phosphatase, partial [Bacteroidota bacterium]
EIKNKEILDSINYARRIQTAILPPDRVFREILKDSFILFRPKDIVAGDFYWIEQYNEHIIFTAADCTGHGVPGAMVSVVCHNALNRAVREFGIFDPGSILDKVRELVAETFEKSENEVRDGMDIALCTLKGNMLSYSGANNPLWIIRNKTAEIPSIEEIKPDKQPIGKYDSEKPFTTHSIELAKGDTFYIFSDGYADQFGGPQGKKFKYKAFKNLLLDIHNRPMSDQKSLLNNEFDNWKGSIEQVDDICVVGVKF